jgi:hypothetical protein
MMPAGREGELFVSSLLINEDQFMMAFGLDADFHKPYEYTSYLDLQTGEIVYVYVDDEDAKIDGMSQDDNKNQRMRVASAPTKFLGIPGLSHGQHHEILKDFIESPWTQDNDARQRARNAYFKSIGGWLKTVGDDRAREAYFAFRDEEARRLGGEFLRKHGVSVTWR